MTFYSIANVKTWLEIEKGIRALDSNAYDHRYRSMSNVYWPLKRILIIRKKNITSLQYACSYAPPINFSNYTSYYIPDTPRASVWCNDHADVYGRAVNL